MISPRLAARADALAADRVPFVTATVVRARHPTSVRPGDTALVLPDGTIEGFVGGACGESAVRLHAARALETGEPVLLRILPGDGEAPASEGAITVQNPCLSGGALEIFLEPRLPRPRITVVGDTPIALALAELGERVGYEVAVSAAAEVEPESVAVVVASHGRAEEDALRGALAAGVPYVGLVASPVRGAAVLDALREAGVEDADADRVRTPAGLHIGARGPEEIALSIVAEIVATRRASDRPPPPVPPSATAVDPVCGMEVAAVEESLHADHEGLRVYFCSEGCRRAFLEDPARYVAAR